MEAPLAAVEMIAAAPPSSCSAVHDVSQHALGSITARQPPLDTLPSRLRYVRKSLPVAGVTPGEMRQRVLAEARPAADTPTDAPADVSSTVTSDEAADQPVPAVRLATERHESDGRFARR